MAGCALAPALAGDSAPLPLRQDHAGGLVALELRLGDAAGGHWQAGLDVSVTVGLRNRELVVPVVVEARPEVRLVLGYGLAFRDAGGRWTCTVVGGDASGTAVRCTGGAVPAAASTAFVLRLGATGAGGPATVTATVSDRSHEDVGSSSVAVLAGVIDGGGAAVPDTRIPVSQPTPEPPRTDPMRAAGVLVAGLTLLLAGSITLGQAARRAPPPPAAPR